MKVNPHDDGSAHYPPMMTPRAVNDTTKSSSSSSTSSQRCHVCHNPATYRCRDCRGVYYCNRQCQRKDWKRHRKVCALTATLPSSSSRSLQPNEEAMKELCELVKSQTIQQSKQMYYQVLDVMMQSDKKVFPEGQNTKLASRKVSSLLGKSRKAEGVDANASSVRSPGKPVDATTTITEIVGNKDSSSSLHPALNISYVIEDLTHLSCFQVLIWSICDNETSLSLSNLIVELPTLSQIKVTVVQPDVSQISIVMELPCRHSGILPAIRMVPLVRVSSASDDNKSPSTAVSIRLPHEIDAGLLDPSASIYRRSLLSPIQSNALGCAHCDQQLIATDRGGIQSVSRLPSGQWEGMEDYLSCSTPMGLPAQLVQPLLALEGRLLQDVTTILLHANDVSMMATCVLAWPAYGQSDTEQYEQEKTPSKLWWKPSGGEGATLTCSQCACILGSVVTLDTYRLFLHQVTIPSPCGNTKAVVPTISIGCFMVGEMVRYAETQAMFTFAIRSTDHTRKLQSHGQRCLILHLVSWETLVANSGDSRVVALSEGEEEKDGSETISTWLHKLSWHRTAKIVYYETATIENIDQVSLWDIDWCCPPSTTGIISTDPNRQGAKVQLELSLRDWSTLQAELSEATQWQPREVVEATVRAKLGKEVSWREDGTMGMASFQI